MDVERFKRLYDLEPSDLRLLAASLIDNCPEEIVERILIDLDISLGGLYEPKRDR